MVAQGGLQAVPADERSGAAFPGQIAQHGRHLPDNLVACGAGQGHVEFCVQLRVVFRGGGFLALHEPADSRQVLLGPAGGGQRRHPRLDNHPKFNHFPDALRLGQEHPFEKNT